MFFVFNVYISCFVLWPNWWVFWLKKLKKLEIQNCSVSLLRSITSSFNPFVFIHIPPVTDSHNYSGQIRNYSVTCKQLWMSLLVRIIAYSNTVQSLKSVQDRSPTKSKSHEKSGKSGNKAEKKDFWPMKKGIITVHYCQLCSCININNQFHHLWKNIFKHMREVMKERLKVRKLILCLKLHKQT